MKNSIITYCILSLVALISCGEDRTNEYLEQTKENQWIYNTMKDVYLWKQNISEPKRSEFFTTQEKFFSSLLNKSDKASFFTLAQPTGDYGMSVALMRDPIAEKPSRVYALVMYVEPNSPAAIAGIERGTWITAVNGKQLTTSSESILKQGEQAKLATEYIEFDNETNQYFWVQSDTIEITASVPYDVCSIGMDSIYSIREKRVGYLLCNNFNGTEFIDNTSSILEEFIAQNTTDIIIDLRYNTGGETSNAAAFASMLVPAELADKPFCTLKDLNEEVDTVYNYTEQPFNIGDRNIFFIIGSDTKGAAELVVSSVNASRDMYEVMVVGQSTSGTNTVVEKFESPYGFSISPVTAVAYSSNGDILSPDGIKPDYTVNELELIKQSIHPLGNSREYLLYNTMYIISNGTLPVN